MFIASYIQVKMTSTIQNILYAIEALLLSEHLVSAGIFDGTFFVRMTSLFAFTNVDLQSEF